jgi:hypothetical protein
MNEWHHSLASIATSDTATLRLRDRYQRMLTMMAERDGVNDARGVGLADADESAGWPFDMATRVCEMVRRVWADVSDGSC